MTLHIRQPLPTAKMGALLDEAVQVSPRKRAPYRKVFKRGLDLLLVMISAPPVLMLVLTFAALIAMDGRSPIYTQERVGRNGRRFRMIKLRSMVPNADRLLEAYLADNPAARAEWDRDQKLRNDPRITQIGQIIRKTSIDELPQLWNVLRGDMSLVGPRPMMPSQQEIYPGTAYYALRPGITGFWQTSVRNESSFAQRAEFDADYLRKLSFLTDVRVIVKTVKVVINGTGC